MTRYDRRDEQQVDRVGQGHGSQVGLLGYPGIAVLEHGFEPVPPGRGVRKTAGCPGQGGRGDSGRSDRRGRFNVAGSGLVDADPDDRATRSGRQSAAAIRRESRLKIIWPALWEGPLGVRSRSQSMATSLQTVTDTSMVVKSDRIIQRGITVCLKGLRGGRPGEVPGTSSHPSEAVLTVPPMSAAVTRIPCLGPWP